ncbi:MAG: hypothetical protein EXR52_03280 [Dehalococcoidia bacterium]|nr:hypothetical protein [Dehalococcoidia bacterium]
MSAFVGGRRYTTDRATLLASGESDSGPEWLPRDKTAFLFRGLDGRYFAQFRMFVQVGLNPHAERYWIEPMAETTAIPLYWELPEKLVGYYEAFASPRVT